MGTAGWSYKDWDTVFYPPGTRAGEYLSIYAERFNIVEVDSTYYRIPAKRTVQGWFDRTPDDFRFAVKMPGLITHEKVLERCEADRNEFLDAIAPLDHKLHSILLQFGYFNKAAFASAKPFMDRLDRFLAAFPQPRSLAVEIRNKNWLNDEFLQLLRSHGAALALADQVWMPPIEQVLDKHDCITGDFLYVRLIGDRHGIEKITTTWDKVVVDRRERIASLVTALAGVISAADVVTFINNHYAGHAPASCDEFLAAMAMVASGQVHARKKETVRDPSSEPAAPAKKATVRRKADGADSRRGKRGG